MGRRDVEHPVALDVDNALERAYAADDEPGTPDHRKIAARVVERQFDGVVAKLAGKLDEAFRRGKKAGSKAERGRVARWLREQNLAQADYLATCIEECEHHECVVQDEQNARAAESEGNGDG